MQADEFKEIIQDNIRLELTDDAPESKLIGIQIIKDGVGLLNPLNYYLRNVGI